MSGTEDTWLRVLEEILDRSHLFKPSQLAAGIETGLSRLGISCIIYLSDLEQQALHPLPRPGLRPPPQHPVETSLPGRVFRLGRALPPAGNHGWLVPMVNGTDRLGVMEFNVAEYSDPQDTQLPKRLATVAGLVGHLVTVTAHKGDSLVLVRRTRPMSPGAELLTRMLPPLTSSNDRFVLSAILEPCYDVGGDGFDYAIDDSVAWLAIFDAVGRGLPAALACTLAMAAVRAARRAGQGLAEQAQAADSALQQQFTDHTFVTAILAELNLETGRLRYLNAGHPAPLVLRGGRVVRELPGTHRLPLGLGSGGTALNLKKAGSPETGSAETGSAETGSVDGHGTGTRTATAMGEEMLEPGDWLLLFSDGVIEARPPGGEIFGLQRLVDLVRRNGADGLPAPETLRRLVQTVVAHQTAVHANRRSAGSTVVQQTAGSARADDLTMVLVEWSAAAAARTVP